MVNDRENEIVVRGFKTPCLRFGFHMYSKPGQKPTTLKSKNNLNSSYWKFPDGSENPAQSGNFNKQCQN